MDSVFNLQRPYDLVALLKQEERAETLESLKGDLLLKKADIDRNEDHDTGVEQQFYRTDPDCIAAGKPLVEFDLYMSTVLPLENKGISVDEYLVEVDDVGPPYSYPQCTDYISLDFSMHAFEHLEGVRERTNLTISPELGLKSVVSFAENIDEYGHLIHRSLLQNSTSWVLYNMAAFYWRIKGNAFQAIECLRRALHYSSRQHKDVALVSLSNILHQAHYSNEAAIVIHAAIDISRELNVNHFTLGNIYAVLAEYNKSVICFENTLLIQPDFEAASLRRYAVLCHAKLEAVLESQHKSLQRTLSELREYQLKHDLWKQYQSKLNSEQAPLSVKIDQRLSYETYTMRLANHGVGELCDMEERDGHRVLQCAWARVKRVLTDYDFMPTSINEQIAVASNKPDSASIDYSLPVRPPLFTSRKRILEKDAGSLPYMASDWPTKEECDKHVKKFPMWNEFPTTFLSPENKGFEVKQLLGIAQGLASNQQHPFPWYPPVCTTLSDIPEGPRSCDHITSVKERSKLPTKMMDAKMKPLLLKNVENADKGPNISKEDSIVELEETNVDDGKYAVTQDEIGQRILTALKKKIGPSWILYNLAALYWRVVGNTVNGLECSRRALYFVPDRYRDVPLVNLANILYRVGRVDDAVILMREALSINEFEPESHFFMGNLLAAASNITGSVHHYREALTQNPLHADAYASLRVISCYQKFHRTEQSSASRETGSGSSQSATPPTSCGNNAPHTGPGETVFVCTKNGDVESCFLTDRRDKCGNAIPVPTHPAVNRLGHPMCTNSQHADTIIMHENNEPLSDTLGDGYHDAYGSDSSLEDIIDYYRQKGVCSGEECDKFMVQQQNANAVAGSCGCRRPTPAYERLEVIEGRLMRQVYIDGNIGEIRPSECIIFGDGRRTDGCSREEFRAYVDKYNKLLVAKSNSPQQQQNVVDVVGFPSNDLVALYIGLEDDLTSSTSDCYSRQVLLSMMDAGPCGPITDTEAHTIPHVSDPVRHISKRATLVRPSVNDCEYLGPQTDFQQPATCWISMTTKLDDVSGFISFDAVDRVDSNQSPICNQNIHGEYRSLMYIGDIWSNYGQSLEKVYQPETDMLDVLQSFDGLAPSTADFTKLDIEKIGSFLAFLLKQNATSWVANNLAMLYWRIKGNPYHAINCAVAAFRYSPKNAVDVALLSIASMFHRSGMLDEALLVTTIALDEVPDIVALHFMMANLYAAKGLLKRAALFYESTIGLQKTFNPAIMRLAAVLCHLSSCGGSDSVPTASWCGNKRSTSSPIRT